MKHSAIKQKYEDDYEKWMAYNLVKVQKAQKAANQMYHYTSPLFSVGSSTNFTLTTTGDSPSWVKEYEVSRIVKRTKNGYFFLISVDATDDVFYRVWKGGWFPYLVAKVFKRFQRDIDGNKSSWNTVTKRTHLPATLGSTYEKIDAAIKADIANEEHESYIDDLLKTKPESLKMIGSLEKLAEGDVDDTKEDPSNGVSANAASNWVAGTSIGATPGAGAMLLFTPTPTPTPQAGTITGVSTLEADKIVLNGTDLAQAMTDQIGEAVAGLDAKVAALEDDVKEINAP